MLTWGGKKKLEVVNMLFMEGTEKDDFKLATFF